MMEEITTAIEAYLRPLVENKQGKVFAAEAPDEMEDKFGMVGKNWSVLLCWEGYEKFEDDPAPNTGLQWARFVFVVEHHSGFQLKRGADIAGFSGLIDLVIAWLRPLQLKDDAGNIALHGMELVDTQWIGGDKPWRRHRVIMRAGPMVTAKNAAMTVQV